MKIAVSRASSIAVLTRFMAFGSGTFATGRFSPGLAAYMMVWPAGRFKRRRRDRRSAQDMADRDEQAREPAADIEQAPRPLPAAARRALAEAEARRRAGAFDPDLPPERNGRKGPEPVRFGDWEKDGIAVDF